MPSNVTKCSCEHPYQDAKYGKGMRVHNFGPTKEIWRCTICGAEKPGKLKEKEPED